MLEPGITFEGLTIRDCQWVADESPDVELISALVAVLRWHILAGGTEQGKQAALTWALSTNYIQKDKQHEKTDQTTH